MSSSFWNDRYTSNDLVYGEAPNDFLASLASKLPRSGQALDIGAGEGRNALFLASLGLDTLAVDQSEVGMQKAQRLARERGLALRTQAVDLRDFNAPQASLDVVTSIFVHLPSSLRADLYKRIPTWLKPGGLFILEAYAPDQLTRDTGGPKDPDMLPPLQTMLTELGAGGGGGGGGVGGGGDGLTIEHSAALIRAVVEGKFHGGEASVIQIVGRRSAR